MSFFRYPHTPHLAWLGRDCPRSDKVMNDREVASFLAGTIIIEEKIDGANLGFSFNQDAKLCVQNRGNFLSDTSTGQFKQLHNWMAFHEDALFDSLDSTLILFGEWMAARHSLDYDNLPDLFVGFDIFDRSTQRFWSTKRRNELFSRLEIQTIPLFGTGHSTLEGLISLLGSSKSKYRNGHPEGFYLRIEDDDWLINRSKLVRAEFVQEIGEHWRSRLIEWNKVRR